MSRSTPAPPFARDPDFWRLVGRSVVIGVGAAIATFAFLGTETLLHHLVWGEADPASGWFEGHWRLVPIVLGASLLVGLLRRATGTTPPDPNFVDELHAGRTEPLHALQLVVIGLVSLVGGASLGPEAPIATAGSGLGTAVAERRPSVRDDEVADQAFAGMAGVFGGLVTFPFAVPVIALELMDPQRLSGYRRLLPGLISGTVALAVVYPVIGAPFLGLFAIPTVPFTSWHLAMAVPLGLVGAVLGLLCALVTGLGGLAAARLRSPVGRALAGGAVLAACGIVAPLTLFSGREELQVVLEQGTELGVGLLVTTVLLKVVAFAVSMRAGFFGGAILPLFFVGGAAGLLVHAAWPAVPLVVAVGCVAAATAAALVSLPLSLLVLTILMFSTGIEIGAAIAVAVLTSHVAVHGTALLPMIASVLAPGSGAATADGPAPSSG